MKYYYYDIYLNEKMQQIMAKEESWCSILKKNIFFYFVTKFY